MFLTKSYSLEHKRSVACNQKYVKSKGREKRPDYSIMKKKADWITKCERLPPKKLKWVGGGVVIIQDQSKMIYNVRNVTKIRTNPAIKDNHLPNSILRPQSCMKDGVTMIRDTDYGRMMSRSKILNGQNPHPKPK
jgi:hypothetical protein